MSNLLFYGIIEFEDSSFMMGEPFLGIARDEIGWVCGPITGDLEDLKLGYTMLFPIQMNEFLSGISTPFDLEYVTYGEALKRRNEINQKESNKQNCRPSHISVSGDDINRTE